MLFLAFLFHLSHAACNKEEYDPLNDRFVFNLPELPYNYTALEPNVWAQLLFFHHQNEHLAYIGELNQVVQSNPKYFDLTVDELLIEYGLESEDVATYAGAHYNHALLWWILMPAHCTEDEPEGELLEDIEERWGSFSDFQQEFTDYATSLFGSGWVWLCANPDGELKLIGLKNEFSPLGGGLCYPFLGIDIWEHAYYITHLYDREAWVKAWWKLIDWDLVEYWYEEFILNGEAVPV